MSRPFDVVMSVIVTPTGHEILLDAADLARLGGRGVSLGSHGYAQVWEPSIKRPILLHRWILGLTDRTGYAFLVDHINRDKLDCRRENLRVVTPRPLPLGVYLTRNGRYHAALKRHRVIHHLGTYYTPEAAEQAVLHARVVLG